MSNLKFSKKLLADFASDILISDIKAYIAEHAEEFAEFKAAHTDEVEISVIGGIDEECSKVQIAS